MVQEEAAVGPFSCDILAKEVDSGLSAAIENQLEWTDHSHFTQLLTYAAGLDARIAIWVAPEFRYEHAATYTGSTSGRLMGSGSTALR